MRYDLKPTTNLEKMILETKQQLPSLKPNTLRRERLLKLLKNNLERKLVLVTGDAGYGKTTLLAQLIQEAHLPCVFYDLDKGDSDLVVFCSYLVHGLEKLKKDLASRTKGLLEQGGEVGKNYELLFGTLINELVEKRKEELFFILDDYHALPEDCLVHQALDYFIDHLPDIVHVVISSRTMPPLLSLAKWRAKEDLFELSREGLRFTEEEVKALLSEVYKLVLSEEEVKRVNEQTEGWITGIRLILQSAGKDGKTVKETLNGYLEAHQPLFEYFANEIVAGESLDVQDFLRKSSILEPLTPETCDQVFKAEGSEKLLASLEKRNLFLSRVGKEVYKYHRLFREFLQNQVKDEFLKKSWHLRAADYYQRMGLAIQAIEHYQEAGSFEWAAKALEAIAKSIGGRGEYGSLQHLLGRLPEAEIAKRPKLLLCRSGLYTWTGNLERALTDAKRAEEAFVKEGLFKEANEAALKVAIAELTLGRFQKARNRLEELLKDEKGLDDNLLAHGQNVLGIIYAQQGFRQKAIRIWKNALFLSENAKQHVLAAMIGNNLGTLEVERGNYRLAVRPFLRALQALQACSHSGAGSIFSNLAQCEIEFGALSEAAVHLQEGLRVAIASGDVVTQIRCFLGISRLQREKGDLNEAERTLCEARACWERIAKSPVVEGNLRREEASLCAARKDWKTTRDLLRGLLEETKERHPEALLMLGRAYLELGDPKGAQEAWLEAIAEGNKKNNSHLLAQAHLSLAYLKEKEKNRKETLKHLRVGLHYTRKGENDSFLRKEKERWFSLLELAQRENIEKDFILSVVDSQELGAPLIQACDLGIRLLGPLEIIRRGRMVEVKWYSRKAKSLFFFLTLHRKGLVPPEKLIEELWPRAKPQLANHSLRQAIYFLRQELAQITQRKEGAVLVHQREGYGFSPDFEICLDTDEFALIVREGTLLVQSEPEKALSLFQQAKAMWRGEPLTGLEEEWCEGFRRGLNERYFVLLLEMGHLFFSRENFGEALASYREAVEVDPYSETTHQGIMRCLGKFGKHKELEEHYHALVTKLWKDLEAEPLPETKRILEEILGVGA